MISFIKSSFSKNNSGFTLIELLLVIAIISITTTVSFAGFSSYNNTVKLNSAAETLKTNINEAKSSALSGFIYRCTSSQSLYGYRFSIDSSTTYSLYEVCQDNATQALTSNQLTNKRVTLGSGITFNPTGINVTFLAVSGIPLSAATFTLRNTSSSVQVVVDSAGVIK